MDLTAAATLMGCPPAEIADVFDSPCGPVIVMRDTTSYIDVDPATPDAVGKTGLMYLNPPRSETGIDGQYAYLGDFPVFTPYPDDDAERFTPYPDDDAEPARVTEPASADGGAAGDDAGHVTEPVSVPPDARAVRAWAREHDIDVPAKGKVPADVIDAYLAATGGS